MIRIALAYLAVAVVAILLVTGLPFGLWPRETEAVAAAPLLAPETPPADIAQNPPAEVTLETLVASAVAAGQSADQIDRLLNQAASQGSVRVPAMMVTTEGRIDTSALIASMAALSTQTPVEQGDASADDSFVTPETAILDIEDMPYLVREGDSLAGLALRFYGNPNLFQPIFEANRDVLATPSSIRAGQRLIIPSRAKL